MPANGINYAAVLADLEAKRAQLDSAIAAIKALMEQSGPWRQPPRRFRVSPASHVPPRAFLGLSISVAARMLLEMVQRRLSIPEIMQGLRSGGLKPSKYRNVYAIMRQRESDKGDVINVKGQWGLAEWNPELHPRSNLTVRKKRQ
jgi:hypothetical protein